MIQIYAWPASPVSPKPLWLLLLYERRFALSVTPTRTVRKYLYQYIQGPQCWLSSGESTSGNSVHLLKKENNNKVINIIAENQLYFPGKVSVDNTKKTLRMREKYSCA